VQDHEHFIKCDPHMISYKTKPPPPPPQSPSDSGATPAPPAPLPAWVADKWKPVDAARPPVVYEVTDRIHALPAGLWDSDVVSTSEFWDLEGGVFVRLHSPLSVLMETVWSVRDAEGGGLELVEDVVISCSRLLVGVVKGQCESNWKGIHGNVVKKLGGDPVAVAAG
jgi:hypothetical protein